MTDLGVQRVADIQLRGAADVSPARVYWPTATSGRPALLVLFSDSEATRRELCARLGAVVLATSCRSVEQAVATTEWVADHAAELGADPGRLLIGGEGAGADLAGAVAVHAGHNGWPAITQQLPIDAAAGLGGLSGQPRRTP